MRYLLDTNVCSDYLKGKNISLLAKVDQHLGELAIASVVLAELYFGAYKGARTAKTLAEIERLRHVVAVLPFDAAAAGAYGRIRASLERAGTPIGGNDTLIAATALARGLTLVTHNTREFARVGPLPVED